MLALFVKDTGPFALKHGEDELPPQIVAFVATWVRTMLSP